MCVRVRVRVLF